MLRSLTLTVRVDMNKLSWQANAAREEDQQEGDSQTGGAFRFTKPSESDVDRFLRVVGRGMQFVKHLATPKRLVLSVQMIKRVLVSQHLTRVSLVNQTNLPSVS